ncbi:Disease resistance protein [Quillaja saponaria]|uniref:Disease resistance protein n=1 Tax=Quillaja saponaria TaxID=32244 RepID=A0AAD7LRM9_QUISA|nr:Disease resistance protein [Quillaja saponaria]
MDFGPILDIITRLWDCSANRIRYIRHLENNLTLLQNARDELKSVYQDVNKVEVAEEQQLKRTNEVSNWLVNVEAKEIEVGLILDKVKALKEKRRTLYVGQKMPHARVKMLPLERITVGLDSSFDEVSKYFKDPSVGTIGIYGMPGVGKTTLLKKFNNDFLATRSHEFDVVIWVVVSQEVIRNKLHIPDEDWLNKITEERAIVIFNILNHKKFVLLLDDIWKRYDLLAPGIPNPDGQNGYRVIFTIRSKELCHKMANRIVRVECLAKEGALKLFEIKVGEETLNSHPSIPDLAKEVVAECRGLPLALVTVGRAMANKKDPDQW